MDRHRQYSGLMKISFGVLACNSALAIYSSWGDTGSVAFVLAADVALALLFLCLRDFERDGGDARRRNIKGMKGIKGAVWLLTTLLSRMFAMKIAPLMLPAVSAVVCLISAAVAAGGFWAFFL